MGIHLRRDLRVAEQRFTVIHVGCGPVSYTHLSDVIVVVTRYFGGILLGTGGLVRAYTCRLYTSIMQVDRVADATLKKY